MDLVKLYDEERNQGWLSSLEPEQLDGWDDTTVEAGKTCGEVNLKEKQRNQ